MKSQQPHLILILITAFLAPIIGGSISAATMPLAPGFGSLLSSIFLGPETPWLTHFVIALPLVVAFCMLLLKRKVNQVPANLITALLAGFLGLLFVSIFFSAFKHSSFIDFTQWTLYIVAFLAVVAGAGRKEGPKLIAAAIFAGCTIAAGKGVIEYGLASDPTWRIFGGWANPNALAGMLLIGIFLGLGFTLTQRGQIGIISMLSTVIIGLALLLTQSKGGLAALAAGILMLVILMFAYRRKSEQSSGLKDFFQSLGKVAITFVLIGFLGVVVQSASKVTPPRNAAVQTPSENRQQAPSDRSILGQPQSRQASSEPNTFSRLSNASETQAQSFGFRILLYKSALQSMKQNPLGYGLGTFQYESSRTGLVTQTVLGHNSFLQLGFEASPIAPLVLIAAGLIWFGAMFKAGRALSFEHNMLRGAIVAAITASVAHNCIDSDLYLFGSGITFFMLLGLGLQLTPTSSSPEFLPKNIRYMTLVIVLGTYLCLLWGSSGQVMKSRSLFYTGTGNSEQAQKTLATLEQFTPKDGEVWALAAQHASSNEERTELLLKATTLEPSTKNLRDLARVYHAQGDLPKALTALQRGLERDPNNLLILSLRLDFLIEAEDTERAKETALKLISIEDTPYYQVRSLPDLVPTQTFEARQYLASIAESPEEKIQYLRAALNGYISYAKQTVPKIKMTSKAGLPSFGGLTMASARDTLNKAIATADELAKECELNHQPGRARQAREQAQALRELLASTAAL